MRTQEHTCLPMCVHTLTQTLLLTWLTVYLSHGLNKVWKQGFGPFASLVFLTLEAELDYNTSSRDTGLVDESIPTQKIKTKQYPWREAIRKKVPRALWPRRNGIF